MKKNLGGRPLKFNEEVVKKLEQAFAIGCTVTEACIYANISRETFYNNCKEGTGLYDRFMELRERPVLKARQTVVANLDNVETAFRYLRCKRREEFSERSELTGADGDAININVVNYGANNTPQVQSSGVPNTNTKGNR